MPSPPENPTRTPLAAESTEVLRDIRDLIIEARAKVAMAVNAEMTLLYWRIGQRIQFAILAGQRADYGQQILATLSQQLAQEFGAGFSYSALTRLIKFSECFPDQQTVEKPLQREFYAELCRMERWSVRTLRKKSIPCCMSVPHCHANRNKWHSMSWMCCESTTGCHRNWCSVTRIFSNFWVSAIITWSAIWKMPFCAKWKNS